MSPVYDEDRLKRNKVKGDDPQGPGRPRGVGRREGGWGYSLSITQANVAQVLVRNFMVPEQEYDGRDLV